MYTIEDVSKALKFFKPSKAPGPYNIAPVMLKHLYPYATAYLTDVPNLYMKSLIIPAIFGKWDAYFEPFNFCGIITWSLYNNILFSEKHPFES